LRGFLEIPVVKFYYSYIGKRNTDLRPGQNVRGAAFYAFIVLFIDTFTIPVESKMQL